MNILLIALGVFMYYFVFVFLKLDFLNFFEYIFLGMILDISNILLKLLRLLLNVDEHDKRA